MKFAIFLTFVPLMNAHVIKASEYSSSESSTDEVTVQTVDVPSDTIGITSVDDSDYTKEEYGSSFDTTVLTNKKTITDTVNIASADDQEYTSGTEESDVNVASADDQEYASGTEESDVNVASADICQQKCDCTKKIIMIPDYTPADYKPVEYTAIAGLSALVVIFVSHVVYEMVSTRRRNDSSNYKLLPGAFNF